MEIGIGSSARGFVVAGLQSELGLKADGIYGPMTVAAVRALQDKFKLSRTGRITEGLCRAAGLTWPTLFERCLNLTSEFEGTGFSLAVGPADTGDSAGVTFGIVGFTSYNGELQRLLRTFSNTNPSTFRSVLESSLGTSAGDFWATIESGDNKALGAISLGYDGRVKPHVKLLLSRLGATTTMRALEIHEARRRYWMLAESQAKELWATPPPRALALMFDVAVQNGGLRELEISDCLAASDEHDTQLEMMWRVVKAIHSRLTSRKRGQRIINDCLGRKRAIVSGHGMVHGREWWVDSFGV